MKCEMPFAGWGREYQISRRRARILSRLRPQHLRKFVTGKVRVKLYKGAVHTIGRESRHSLYKQELLMF